MFKVENVLFVRNKRSFRSLFCLPFSFFVLRVACAHFILAFKSNHYSMLEKYLFRLSLLWLNGILINDFFLLFLGPSFGFRCFTFWDIYWRHLLLSHHLEFPQCKKNRFDVSLLIFRNKQLVNGKKPWLIDLFWDDKWLKTEN